MVAFGILPIDSIAPGQDWLFQALKVCIPSTTAVWTVCVRRSAIAAVERYQKALLEYRDVFKSDAAVAAAARQKAIDACNDLQQGFQREIEIVKPGLRRSKSLALSRASRGLSIARKSRRVVKLHISDELQATRLVRFGRYGRCLGNGLAVIDFGRRVSHIHDTYEADGDWCREMFIESMSFTLSSLTGTIVVAGGLAVARIALGALLSATPAGWVLIVVGLGVAAAAAGTSIYVDNTITENAGGWYDAIMKGLTPK